MAGGIIAAYQKLPVSSGNPKNTVTKIGFVGLSKSVGVSRRPPDIDAPIFSQFYFLDDIVIKNRVHKGIHDDVLLRPQNKGATQRMFGGIEGDGIWQRVWENGGLGAISYPVSRGLSA